MRNLRCIFLGIVFYFLNTMDTSAQKTYSYLALGDSYTIGEGLPFQDNFPSQTVTLLKISGMYISDPVVIAKTGWTTDELMNAIEKSSLNKTYDFVSLLIGVNNQYRGRDITTYQKEFEQLLQQAISFAGGNHQHVFVLSIPDWGVTPFAEGRDRIKIAKEINQFNAVNQSIAAQYKVPYIEITEGTRQAKHDPSLVAEDKLHPSSKEYAKWADKLSTAMRLSR